MQDHPRRCGENADSTIAVSSSWGSPPQVRGKHLSRVWAKRRNGITPAGAGKTCLFGQGRRVSWDHPRRCGENPQCKHGRKVRTGSPPQVRGKRRRAFLSADMSRITPAGAGKTSLLTSIKSTNWDHPRRCGENVIPFVDECWIVGSPPQVRGKLPLASTALTLMGITPAGAGKTGCSCPEGLQSGDHPRRCGENKIALLVGRGSPGSPPQVRGKPVRSECPLSGLRITPAGAGKTAEHDEHDTPNQDHPRRCGENFTFRRNFSNTSGSPPQVRGKQSKAKA